MVLQKCVYYYYYFYFSPPDLRRKAASDKLMTHIAARENWPVHAEVFQPLTKRLVSRHPIWTNPAPIDISGQWRGAGESASVVNHGLVPDPAIRQLGFDLPRRSWSFRRGQGPYRANLFKWFLSTSGRCKCGQPQTMTHIVDSCTESSLDGGLPRLHSVDEYASTWLNSVAKEALAK